MEKKGPIKRSKNLVWLSRDHHDGLLIAWKIRQGKRLGVSNSRMQAFVVSAFEKELEPHFQEEENLLFIQLPNDALLRLKAEEEHAAIRKMIAACKLPADVVISDLDAFANLLEAHIRFEERVLFPHIEKEILPGILEEIGNKLEVDHLAKQAFVWDDEFWIKEKV